MKYVYILIALALIGGGYYVYSLQQQTAKETATSGNQSNTAEPVNSQMPQNVSAPQGSTGVGANAMQQVNVSGAPSEEQQENAQGTQEQSDTNAAVTSQTTMTANPHAKVFEVHGTKFAFDVKQITVKKGDTVTINFHSDDGSHNWAIDAFHAATPVVGPGVPASVTFVADTAGTFEYYCAVANHRAMGMVGKLIVEG